MELAGLNHFLFQNLRKSMLVDAHFLFENFEKCFSTYLLPQCSMFECGASCAKKLIIFFVERQFLSSNGRACAAQMMSQQNLIISESKLSRAPSMIDFGMARNLASL